MRRLLIITLLAITGCSNQGMYEALRQNECFKNEGVIYCEDDRDYKKYMREREKLLNESKTSEPDEKSAKTQENLPNLFQ